jgi:hypothetical protein
MIDYHNMERQFLMRYDIQRKLPPSISQYKTGFSLAHCAASKRERSAHVQPINARDLPCLHAAGIASQALPPLVSEACVRAATVII